MALEQLVQFVALPEHVAHGLEQPECCLVWMIKMIIPLHELAEEA